MLKKNTAGFSTLMAPTAWFSDKMIRMYMYEFTTSISPNGMATESIKGDPD